MLIIPIVCMLCASLAFLILSFFVKKGSPLVFLLQTMGLACLLGVGLTCGNYQNNFGGFTVLLLISMIPAFLVNYDLKSFLKVRSENTNVEDLPKLTRRFLESNGNLFLGIGLFLSAVCISFAGMYKGYETYYGLLIGLALGLSLTFLALIFRKKITGFDFIGFLLAYTAAGLFLSSIITILVFEISTQNIVICIGLAFLSAYASTKSAFNRRFLDIFYYLGMLTLFGTILF